MITSVVMRTLARAVPGRVPAPASGAGGSLSSAGRHPATGRWYSQYEIFNGGAGARPDADGPSAMDDLVVNVMNGPVEALETEFPIRVERYELIPNSGGPGKFRGGLGQRRKWRILAEESTVNLRTDRFKHASPGIFGARPAKPSRALLNPGTPSERPLSSKVAGLRSSAATWWCGSSAAAAATAIPGRAIPSACSATSRAATSRSRPRATTTASCSSPTT